MADFSSANFDTVTSLNQIIDQEKEQVQALTREKEELLGNHAKELEDLKTQHFVDLTVVKQTNYDLAKKLVEEKVKFAQLQSELSDVKQHLVLS